MGPSASPAPAAFNRRRFRAAPAGQDARPHRPVPPRAGAKGVADLPGQRYLLKDPSCRFPVFEHTKWFWWATHGRRGARPVSPMGPLLAPFRVHLHDISVNIPHNPCSLKLMGRLPVPSRPRRAAPGRRALPQPHQRMGGLRPPALRVVGPAGRSGRRSIPGAGRGRCRHAVGAAGFGHPCPADRGRRCERTGRTHPPGEPCGSRGGPVAHRIGRGECRDQLVSGLSGAPPKHRPPTGSGGLPWALSRERQQFPPAAGRATAGTRCSRHTRCTRDISTAHSAIGPNLERFPCTRGVIRLMAEVIHSLWMNEGAYLLIRPSAAGHRRRGRRLGWVGSHHDVRDRIHPGRFATGR